jgi:hypothetical protein
MNGLSPLVLFFVHLLPINRRALNNPILLVFQYKHLPSRNYTRMDVPESITSLGGWIRALRHIHEVGHKGNFPAEVRLMIFEDWLRDNQSPWDISKELRIPGWVTPSYEDLWFRNTEFILPGSISKPGTFRQSAVMSLDAHVVSFLERLCRRQSAQPTPVSVEVVVDISGDLRLSQDSIRRLLLVSYYLGARKELLNVRVVVDTESPRGNLEANEAIANPLMARLRKDCLRMRKFREGSMNMAKVYSSVGRVYNSVDSAGAAPENVVATVLGEDAAWAQIYRTGVIHSRNVLNSECRKFMIDVVIKEIEAKEEEEKAKQT